MVSSPFNVNMKQSCVSCFGKWIWVKHTCCVLLFFFFSRWTLMGSLAVWAVAVAALLGASGCWLAEGHKSSRRAGLDVASVARTSSREPRSMVNASFNSYQTLSQTQTMYCSPLRLSRSLSSYTGTNQPYQQYVKSGSQTEFKCIGTVLRNAFLTK